MFTLKEVGATLVLRTASAGWLTEVHPAEVVDELFRGWASKEKDVAQLSQVVSTCDVRKGVTEAEATSTLTVETKTYQCEWWDAHRTEFSATMDVWFRVDSPGRIRAGVQAAYHAAR